ncbi:MAG: histidine kinase [Ruminococcus sp.]
MKEFLRSKKLTAAMLGFTGLLLIVSLVLCALFYFEPFHEMELGLLVEGEYAIDGGDMKPLSGNPDMEQSFTILIAKGKLHENCYIDDTITISSRNVWYIITDKDGGYISGYLPPDDDKGAVSQYADGEQPGFAERLSDHLRTEYTPGYHVNQIWTRLRCSEAQINREEDVNLMVWTPYDLPKQRLSGCLHIYGGSPNVIYSRFFYSLLPLVLLFALVCFFGVFFFPIAGFILGRIDYKYLAFGALCFFWAVFMTVDNISGFMPTWISDPVVCMILDVVTNYLFIVSVFFYLKSNLDRSVHRAIVNVLAMVMLAAVVVCLVLQFTNAADMVATSPWLFGYTALCAVVMATLLFLETKNNRRAYFFLISWIPLALTVILDVANYYLRVTDIFFYNFGIVITLIYQLVRLVLDLRTQYKEAIRYQQMQKELYEARVSIMVSQIQPHFLYNSLTSIAMMCTKDPQLAKTATINFADYLRGNMNSLREKNPVPFTQELEHLKKYLMLEQMRFGDMLNIVYDIQATDFRLPQLSVQPLVENAVKHGVGMKEDGGTVTIATRERDDCYEVIITDDGVGFDTSAPPKNDGRSHVGMENTKQRLREMCGAEVIVESEVGMGTVSTIRIPKEEKPQ